MDTERAVSELKIIRQLMERPIRYSTMSGLAGIWAGSMALVGLALDSVVSTRYPRDPHDKAMHDLVGELSTRSPDFRRRWSAHDVRLHGAGSKQFHHQVVGDLELAYESVDMISEPGLTLTIYAAEPASPTADALTLLASWAATQPRNTPEKTR